MNREGSANVNTRMQCRPLYLKKKCCFDFATDAESGIGYGGTKDVEGTSKTFVEELVLV